MFLFHFYIPSFQVNLFHIMYYVTSVNNIFVRHRANYILVPYARAIQFHVVRVSVDGRVSAAGVAYKINLGNRTSVAALFRGCSSLILQEAPLGIKENVATHVNLQ